MSFSREFTLSVNEYRTEKMERVSTNDFVPGFGFKAKLQYCLDCGLHENGTRK